MSVLHSLSIAAGRAVSVLQHVALVVAPQGGQGGSRSNAVLAIAVGNDLALDRRRADAAIRAASVRHPCVRPHQERPLLVAAR
jgi:hypothetical protein